MINGLSDTNIQKIQNVFKQFPQIQKVILFGSRAKGNFKNGSDIDLALLGENLDSTLLAQIEIVLDDLYLPYFFDLCIFENIQNLALKEHIDRVGKIFYEKVVLPRDQFFSK